MAAKKQKRAPGVTYPSESSAARAARGRHRVQFEISTDAREHLEELSTERGRTKSSLVEEMINIAYLHHAEQKYGDVEQAIERIEKLSHAKKGKERQ